MSIRNWFKGYLETIAPQNLNKYQQLLRENQILWCYSDGKTSLKALKTRKTG